MLVPVGLRIAWLPVCMLSMHIKHQVRQDARLACCKRCLHLHVLACRCCIAQSAHHELQSATDIVVASAMQVLLSADSKEQVISIMEDLSQMKTVPLLQGVLFGR